MAFGYSCQPMICASTKHSSPFSSENIQQLLRSRRVAVIGNQGAGKSAFANKLAKIIGIDYVVVHWSRGITTPEKEEFKRQMAMRENWIVDGGFGLLDMVEIVIHLDFPLFVCLWRACTRSIKWFMSWDFRSTKVFAAIPGHFIGLLRLLMEIYRYPSKEGSRPPPQPSSGSCKTLITLKSPKELDLFLSAIVRHLMETGSVVGNGGADRGRYLEAVLKERFEDLR